MFHDPDRQHRPIRGNPANPEPALRRQTFWWMIRIAREFGIINASLENELDWLRTQRNTVHLQERSTVGKMAFLNQSKRAFDTVTRTILQTKAWKTAHP